MLVNDQEYHARREQEHRAQAAAAVTKQAKLAHIVMADLHAARVVQLRRAA